MTVTNVALVTAANAELGVAVVRRLLASSDYTRIMLATQADTKSVLEILQGFAPGAQIVLCTHPGDTYPDVEAVITYTTTHFGGLDCAVNCVAPTSTKDDDTDSVTTGVEDFPAGLRSTSRMLWMLCKAQASYFTSLPRSDVTHRATMPRIVNVFPYGNVGVRYGQISQAAGSYGCVGITKTLARDLSSQGIRVNAVSHATLFDGNRLSEQQRENPSTEEVASGVAFLASPDSSGITGVVLPVDCGWNLTHS